MPIGWGYLADCALVCCIAPAAFAFPNCPFEPSGAVRRQGVGRVRQADHVMGTVRRGNLHVLTAAGRLGPDVSDLVESDCIVKVPRAVLELRRLLEVTGGAGAGMLEQVSALRKIVLAEGRCEAREQHPLFELAVEGRPERARCVTTAFGARFRHLTILLIVANRRPRARLHPIDRILEVAGRKTTRPRRSRRIQPPRDERLLGRPGSYPVLLDLSARCRTAPRSITCANIPKVH